MDRAAENAGLENVGPENWKCGTGKCRTWNTNNEFHILRTRNRHQLDLTYCIVETVCSAIFIRRPSVCRLSSVTFVHPTRAIQIFGNVSTPFGTLATRWNPGKILRRSSRGKPPSGELNTREVAEYSDFGPIERSRKRWKIGAKLVLITIVAYELSIGTKPSDLDDLERRNSHNGRVISPHSVAFGADYLKWIT